MFRAAGVHANGQDLGHRRNSGGADRAHARLTTADPAVLAIADEDRVQNNVGTASDLSRREQTHRDHDAGGKELAGRDLR